jgi:dolichol-phosphate mannosyltransferase
VWNALNDWASFWFQSGRRMVDETTFTLPNLLGSILFWLTPTGVVALAPVLNDRLRTIALHNRETARKTSLLLMTLTLAPLAVFAVFSLTREYRFHWGGTLLLATLPLLGLYLRTQPRQPESRLLTLCQRAWPPTIVVAMILYGAALHYLAMGLPGAPLPKGPLLLGYTQLGCEVERLTRAHQREHNAQPVVIGMDRVKLASGIAYYRTTAGSCAGPGEAPSAIESTTSSHLFGRRTGMFEHWTPTSELQGRPLLLVTGKAEQLDLAKRAVGLTWLAPVGNIDISHNGREVARYYYRLAKWR